MSDEDFENTSSHRDVVIRRRIRQSRMERNVRRSKRFVQRIRALLGLCLMLAVCYCAYRFAKLPQWYLSPAIFANIENNKQIQIEGNVVTPDYRILNVLRHIRLPHIPIYMIDTKEMELSIEQLAPVKKAYIRRFGFPARLIIRIEERVPVLTIGPNEKVPPIAFFTACGKFISHDYMPLPSEYKTYRILSYGIRGDDYANWTIQKVNTLLFLAKEMEKLSGEHVHYIDLRDPKDIYIKLDSALVRIGEMNDTLYHRIKNIGSILPSISKLKDKKIKYVDLRWETNYLKIDSHYHEPISQDTTKNE